MTEQQKGLTWSGLLVLISFCDPFNLASGGFVAVPSFISSCSDSWRQEKVIHRAWIWPIRNDGHKSLHSQEAHRVLLAVNLRIVS